ncbi:chemotaxis protein CheD [Fictibacillus iocasae]|uniref:Probable chemoreceptor glutamine deamidase CheD n=1 Tax=Fictibacillus iocasae TaxID=2715437 RepID=A0ABW2NS97_9BACL
MNDVIKDVMKIGIAGIGTVKTPQKIRTAGLGSCVGVVLFDSSRQIGGMVHIMLPDSSIAKGDNFNEGKFADTGVKLLQILLAKEGARSLAAKLAGGAQMFQFSGGGDLMRIGPRNVEAVKHELAKLGIPILSEDTGGSCGRTIEFDPMNGELQVKTATRGISVI